MSWGLPPSEKRFVMGQGYRGPGDLSRGQSKDFFDSFRHLGKEKAPSPIGGEDENPPEKYFFYSRARARRRKIHPVRVTAERRVVRTMIPLASTASLPICLAMI